MTWADAYTANFGKPLDQRQADAIEVEVENRIHRLQPGELIAAVRNIAERRRVGDERGKFAPDANDIISAIIRRRAESRAARDQTTMPADQRIAEAKARIRAAKTIDDVWAIVSAEQQSNLESGCELEEFAKHLFGARFSRPERPTPERCAEISAEQGIPLTAAHRIAWDEANSALAATFAGIRQGATPQARPAIASLQDAAIPAQTVSTLVGHFTQPDVPPRLPYRDGPADEDDLGGILDAPTSPFVP